MVEGFKVRLDVRHGDEADAPHLVFGFFAPLDMDRRIRRVVRIVRRVVPMNFPRQRGSFGQWNKVFEEIPVLPGKIPVLDEQKRLNLAVREGGSHFHLGGEVMGVCADANSIHRDRQRIGIAQDKILFTGGNIES